MCTLRIGKNSENDKKLSILTTWRLLYYLTDTLWSKDVVEMERLQRTWNCLTANIPLQFWQLKVNFYGFLCLDFNGPKFNSVCSDLGSRFRLSVRALGSGSRFGLSVRALGSGSRFKLSVQALGSTSRFRLSVRALRSGSRCGLSVRALGAGSRCGLSVRALSSFYELAL